MKKILQKVYFFAFMLMILLATNVQAATSWSIDLGFGSGGGSGYAPSQSYSSGGGGYGGSGLDLSNNYGLPTGSIYDIITNLLYWLLGLFSVLGIIGFVIAGILYLTSAGDEGQIDRAKTAMTYSIIGVLVGLIGFVVLQAVHSMLSAQSQF
jgi:hypothetical protein